MRLILGTMLKEAWAWQVFGMWKRRRGECWVKKNVSI